MQSRLYGASQFITAIELETEGRNIKPTLVT